MWMGPAGYNDSEFQQQTIESTKMSWKSRKFEFWENADSLYEHQSKQNLRSLRAFDLNGLRQLKAAVECC